jgi:hypothetical protein
MSIQLCPIVHSSFERGPRELPIKGDGCKTKLFFGFFFDGTKNNYVQAEAGKSHSNIARLYDC